jgi:hypothetical protein
MPRPAAQSMYNSLSGHSHSHRHRHWCNMLAYMGQQLLIIYWHFLGSSPPNMYELTSDLFLSSTSYFPCNWSHACLVSSAQTTDLLLSGDRNHSSLHVGFRLPLQQLLMAWSSPPSSLFLSLSISHLRAIEFSDTLLCTCTWYDHLDKGIKSGLDLYMSPHSLLAPYNSNSRRDGGTLIIPKPPSVCLLMNPRLMTTRPHGALLLPSPPPAELIMWRDTLLISTGATAWEEEDASRYLS